MDPAEALAELQAMGFCLAACERALRVSDNSLDRAIDWLLANPSAASGQSAAADEELAAIWSMGFDADVVQRAMLQADGNEGRAVDLIISNSVLSEQELRARSAAAPPVPLGASDALTAASRVFESPTFQTHLGAGTAERVMGGDDSAAARDDRPIFQMGFPHESVLRALRRSGDREDRAIEMLLQGLIADAAEDPPSDPHDSPRSREMEDLLRLLRMHRSPQPTPPEWTTLWGGTADEFDEAMRSSRDIYMAWCSSSLSGGVRANREHHTQWLLSQLSECAAAFDQIATPPPPLGDSSRASRLVTYMLRTFRVRYPGIRVELGEVRLNIDRSRVVDSTTDEFNAFDDESVKSMGVIKIRFTGQQGYDAGGLTDDWLSLYMSEAMDLYRRPPLFLPPLQMEGETSCLRINHSLRVMGVPAERQNQLFRTFGIVLGICMRRGRFACNKHMLSKSLLQRLLGQELPDGIVSLKEEYPDDYNFLARLQNMRAAGDTQAFDAYLQQGDKKYVVSSRIADFETIKRNLTWNIARTTRYIASVEENGGVAVAPPSPPDPEYAVAGSNVADANEPLRERFDLLMQVVAPFAGLPLTKDNIKAVKTAFITKNSELAKYTRFSIPSTDEIRRAVGVVKGEVLVAERLPKRAETWQDKKTVLLQRMEQQQRLCEDLAEAAQALASQRQQPEAPPSPSDALESFVTHDSVYVPEETSVTSSNFDSYCADSVMKRMHVDVDEALSAMSSGFNAIQPLCPALLEMDCARLQKKLFPLDPITAAAFKANARGHYDVKHPLMALFWKVLEEDLSEEQLAGLFYFATNFHTLCNATQHISISIDSSIRDGLPRAATCSWSLRLPNYMVPGDSAPDFPLSRARLLQGLLVAANSNAHGYGFG